MSARTIPAVQPLERIENFEEFHPPLPEEERRKQGGPVHGLRRALLPVGREAGRDGSPAVRCTT